MVMLHLAVQSWLPYQADCRLHLPPMSRKTGQCLPKVPSFSLKEGYSVPLGSLALSLLSFHLLCYKMGILKCHPPDVCAVLYEIGQVRSEGDSEAQEGCDW